MNLIVANWKMAPDTTKAATALAKKTATIAKTYKKKTSLVVCAPFVHLAPIAILRRPASLGAQSVGSTDVVASTGLVSATMLKSIGVEYCIIGHSESRSRGESNDEVKAQLDRLLAKKITPILCVGEQERDTHGWYLSTVKDQIESALANVPKATLKRIVIAYEPVWAIGAKATREATPIECREMVIFIQKVINDLYNGEKVSPRILYGGSVSVENAATFITEGTVQGLLVGRVSLDPKAFGTLVKNVSLIA